MARLSLWWYLHRARLGDVERMPAVLQGLAQRLRANDLDDQEKEFLADALDRIARAKDPKKEAANALGLVRGRGTRTKAEAMTLSLDRASRVRTLVRGGNSVAKAIADVAVQDGLKDDADIRRAYYHWLPGLTLTEEVNQE